MRRVAEGVGVAGQCDDRVDRVDVVAGHLYLSHQRVARGHRIQTARATIRAGNGPAVRNRDVADVSGPAVAAGEELAARDDAASDA